MQKLKVRPISFGTHKQEYIIRDNSRQLYSDIEKSLSFDDKTNDIKKKINMDSIQQSILGIISTEKGERPFEPEFGSSMSSALFENMNDSMVYVIENSIREAIQNYEPRVSINSVVCIPHYSQNAADVDIRYTPVNNSTSTYKLKVQIKGNI